MTRHTKQAIIVSVVILLVCLTALVVVFKHKEIGHFYRYLRCRTIDADDRKSKVAAVEEFSEAQALYFLRRMLSDGDEFVRNLAGVRLYEAGDEQSLAVLFPHLKGKDRQKFNSAYSYLRCVTTDADNTRFRQQMIYAFYKRNEAFFAPRLFIELSPEDRMEIIFMIYVAVKNSQYGKDQRETILGIFLAALADETITDPLIAYALSELGDRRALAPLRKALAAEKDVNAREEIRKAIAKLEKAN